MLWGVQNGKKSIINKIYIVNQRENRFKVIFGFKS